MHPRARPRTPESWLRPSSCPSHVCKRVLEHRAEPAGVVAEAHRLLRSGANGRARVTPIPEDYSRLAHAGLAELFKSSAPWSVAPSKPMNERRLHFRTSWLTSTRSLPGRCGSYSRRNRLSSPWMPWRGG